MATRQLLDQVNELLERCDSPIRFEPSADVVVPNDRLGRRYLGHIKSGLQEALSAGLPPPHLRPVWATRFLLRGLEAMISLEQMNDDSGIDEDDDVIIAADN